MQLNQTFVTRIGRPPENGIKVESQDTKDQYYYVGGEAVRLSNGTTILSKMPSSRATSEEQLEHVTIPDGTEKVVNIRKVDHASSEMNTMIPLSVQTGYTSNMRTSETQMHEMRSEIRKRTKSSGHKKSSRDHARRSQVYAQVQHGASGDQRRVVSCVDLTAPEPVESHLTLPIGTEEDSTLTAGTQNASKSIRRIRGRHREEWLSAKSEEVSQSRWHQSHIFAPDSSKHRSGSRSKTVKLSRATPVQVSPSPGLWSPYIPVPISYMSPTCPRCCQPPFSASHEKFTSYPHAVNGYYPPYLPYSADNIPSHLRSTSMHRHHQYRMHHQHEEPVYNLPGQHLLHNSNHPHYTRARTPQNASPSTLKYASSERHAIHNETMDGLEPVDLNGLDRTVDLMEIEYAAGMDDNRGTYLSSEALNMIVKLAKEFNKNTERLEEIAKELKLALDERLGEKWHVVIGDDSFGSNLASLPGALANFKLGKNVFLVWQT